MSEEQTGKNRQTGLARQAEQRCPSLAADEARKVFRNELTACLALVAPAGMTEDSRREWLAVAWDTLKDVEPSDLQVGARAARKKCDHPAKIVPTILAEIEAAYPWRAITRHRRAETRPERLIEPNYITPEEASEILREVGLRK